MQRIIKAAGLIAVFLIVSCVTVNIYFPAAEVQKAADRIVDDVRTKGSEAVPETPPPAPSSRLDVMSSLRGGQVTLPSSMRTSRKKVRMRPCDPGQRRPPSPRRRCVRPH